MLNHKSKIKKFQNCKKIIHNPKTLRIPTNNLKPLQHPFHTTSLHPQSVYQIDERKKKNPHTITKGKTKKDVKLTEQKPRSEKRKRGPWREINLEDRGTQGFIANAAIEDIRVWNEDWNGPNSGGIACRPIWGTTIGWSRMMIFTLLKFNWTVYNFEASSRVSFFFFFLLFPASLLVAVAGSFSIIIPTNWNFHHLSLSLSLSDSDSASANSQHLSYTEMVVVRARIPWGSKLQEFMHQPIAFVWWRSTVCDLFKLYAFNRTIEQGIISSPLLYKIMVIINWNY